MNEKVTRWLHSVMCSVGWGVDKLITGSLLVLWPVITLLTWASGCCLNPFKHQWFQWDDQSIVDLHNSDNVDVPLVIVLSMLADAVLAAALAVLCIVACWMWRHVMWSIIIIGITAVLVFLGLCYREYRGVKDGSRSL